MQYCVKQSLVSLPMVSMGATIGCNVREGVCMNSGELIDRLLAVLNNDVLPLTSEAVKHGNKVFGAAILKKTNLELVVAGTNEETKNPLLHGEVSCLNRFWAMPERVRPEPKQCLFLSSHEPCSLCLSAITWSGFDNFYYMFSYEDSRDKFAIPHDLNILKEVFKCDDGNYAPVNAYWHSHYLVDLVEQESGPKQQGRMDEINALRKQYGELSTSYQEKKDQQPIPLA